MDKFGIFNLLNSFLNFSNSTGTEKETSPTPQNAQKSGNILSTLTELLNKNALGNSSQNTPAPAKNIQAETPPLPLQSQMISTMNSHDDFIKRVKDKNARK